MTMTFMLWRKDGEQFFDENGNPLAAGTLEYKLAGGPETNLSIFADPAGATPLDNPVTLDAAGRINGPIYVGEQAFKERGKKSSGVVVFENDGYLGSPPAVAPPTFAKGNQAVSPVASSRAITSADHGNILVCDPTGGDITLTLETASGVINGRGFKAIHAGASGKVIIQRSGNDLVGGLPAIVLKAFGDAAEVVCDTTAWRIAASSDGIPQLGRAVFLTVETRSLSTPPVSPVQGARYILAAAGTGAWLGFAVNAVVEFTGTTWVGFAPVDGWYADIKSEDIVCRFSGSSWIPWTNVLAPASSNAAVAVFQDSNPSGTAAQLSTAAAWNTSRLNTQLTLPVPITGASLAGNVMTIPAGKYAVRAWRAMRVTSATTGRARLISTTDPLKVFYSSTQSVSAASGASLVQQTLFADVEVTAATENFTLEFYSPDASNAGVPASLASIPEIYASVHWVSTASLQGPIGAQGLAGTDAGIRWAFDSSTATAADPGPGKLRLNNATLANVTEIAVSYLSGESGAPSVETFVKTWDDSSSPSLRGTLIIKKLGAPQNFLVLGITSVITDGATFGRFTVDHRGSSGSFNALDVLSVVFYRTGDAIVGRRTIWVPAAAMLQRTTNGAAMGNVETVTNKNIVRTLDFDPVTQEFAQFVIRMPKSWNEGTVQFQPVWSHAATATNFGVVWELAAVAVGDNEALDVAFGTAQASADTGGTTDRAFIGPLSAAITIAGPPAAEDYVMFQVARAPANVADTLAVDARLHGISLYITTDANTDD
jgi:Protein of unknown function (DUF2793)